MKHMNRTFFLPPQQKHNSFDLVFYRKASLNLGQLSISICKKTLWRVFNMSRKADIWWRWVCALSKHFELKQKHAIALANTHTHTQAQHTHTQAQHTHTHTNTQAQHTFSHRNARTQTHINTQTHTFSHTHTHTQILFFFFHAHTNTRTQAQHTFLSHKRAHTKSQTHPNTQIHPHSLTHTHTLFFTHTQTHEQHTHTHTHTHTHAHTRAHALYTVRKKLDAFRSYKFFFSSNNNNNNNNIAGQQENEQFATWSSWVEKPEASKVKKTLIFYHFVCASENGQARPFCYYEKKKITFIKRFECAFIFLK